MNKISLISITTTVALASSLLLGPGTLHARPARLEVIQQNWYAKAEPTAPARQAKKARAIKPEKVKQKSTRLVAFPEDRNKHGSRETESQRSERLSRECRGAVNAGACAGYTR